MWPCFCHAQTTKIRNLNAAKEEVADTELLQLAVFPHGLFAGMFEEAVYSR